MRKVSLHWMVMIAIGFSTCGSSGCALFTGQGAGVALQPDQEYVAPSSGAHAEALVNEGHRYVCQTFVAGRDGVLAALSVDIYATRFRKVSRRDSTLPRTLLLPAHLFPQYNLSISLFSVQGSAMQERLLDFQIPCDNAKFDCDRAGRTLDTVILLPKQLEQRKSQKYAICAYYPDAPWSGGGNAVGAWVGGVQTNGDQEIICGDDGLHWDFKCWPDISLNFRTFGVSTCEQPGRDIDKTARSVESAIAIPRNSIYPEWDRKIHQAATAGATEDDISLVLGSQPDTCEDIEPTPKLGMALNADGTIASLSRFSAGAKAGLSAGEKVLMVNGIRVSTAKEVVQAVRTTVKWDEPSAIVTDKKTYTVDLRKPSKALACHWGIRGGSSMQIGGSVADKHGESASQAGRSQTDSGSEGSFRASCRFDDGIAVVCHSSWLE